MYTVQSSQLTRIDNEYVALAAEVKGDKTVEHPMIPVLPLLQRSVEDMRKRLEDKLDKTDLPGDIVTLSTFTEVADMNFLANKIADVLTARMGGKARLASALINAASHVQSAAQHGIGDFLENVINDLITVNPSLFSFEGDSKTKFANFLRLICDKINYLVGYHEDRLSQLIRPASPEHDLASHWPYQPRNANDEDPDKPLHRDKRQVDVLQTLRAANEVRKMYQEWKNSYDTYWFGRLKYLDNERVKNYIMPGGILDNWLTLFTNMQERIDALGETTSTINVHKTLEFYDDVPRFVGKPKNSTGGRYSITP